MIEKVEKLGETSGKVKDIIGDISKGKRREFRPLPSINVMKNRLEKHFNKEIKNFLILSKKTNSYFEISENIANARKSKRKILDLKDKTPDLVKKDYFNLFGHLHGIEKLSDGE